MAGTGRTTRDGLGELRLERRGQVSVRVRRLVVPPDVASQVEADVALAMSMDHPAIVRVLAVERRPDGLELVSEAGVGVPLRKFLTALAERGEKLAVSHATWIALEVLKLLQAAQAHTVDSKIVPVVHGRLSPGHIILTRQGEVRVGGFGLDAAARAVIGPSGPLDRTFGYVGPEQGEGRARPESDTFALGSILYEMILGEQAFVGRTLAETLAAAGSRKPRSLRASRSEVPLALDEAVAWCLEKSADRRPRAEPVVARLSAFQGVLDVGDRVRSGDHASKLADLLRLRLAKEELTDDVRVEEVPAEEPAVSETRVIERVSARRKIRASRVALAALVAVGAWVVAGAATWPRWRAGALDRLPSDWRDSATHWLPAVPDAGGSSPVVQPAPPDAGAAKLAAALAPALDAGGQPEPEHIPRPAPAPAVLTIGATAPGRVRLDGEDLGTTPLQDIRVAAGNHRVEIIGLRPKLHATQTFTVEPGERKTLLLRLRRHP